MKIISLQLWTVKSFWSPCLALPVLEGLIDLTGRPQPSAKQYKHSSPLLHGSWSRASISTVTKRNSRRRERPLFPRQRLRDTVLLVIPHTGLASAFSSGTVQASGIIRQTGIDGKRTPCETKAQGNACSRNGSALHTEGKETLGAPAVQAPLLLAQRRL